MADNFTRYASYVTQIPLAWMGRTAQKIWSGFATVLGDWAEEWGQKANLEHLPQYADAEVLPFIGSERQLAQGPGESNTDYAERLIYWLNVWGFAGRPLGLLLALHYAGFDFVVFVQQNGRWYQLNDTVINVANPLSNLISGDLATLPAPMTSTVTPGYSVPQEIPWWTFDSNPEFASRFALMFEYLTPTLSAANLALIRPIVAAWKAARTTCVGLYAIDFSAGGANTGQWFDLDPNDQPPRTFDDLAAMGTFDDLEGISTFYASE